MLGWLEKEGHYISLGPNLMILWYTALWLPKEKRGEFAGYVVGCREVAPLMSEDTSLQP